MTNELIANYWTTALTSTYWGGPAGNSNAADRSDYLKLVARRSQKSREATRGTYRKQFLSNTEIA